MSRPVLLHQPQERNGCTCNNYESQRTPRKSVFKESYAVPDGKIYRREVFRSNTRHDHQPLQEKTGLKNCPHCRRPWIDDQEVQDAFQSVRQKACKFIESDSSSNISEHQCKCSTTGESDSVIMRRARDLLDYSPQSSFLKNLKQRSQNMDYATNRCDCDKYRQPSHVEDDEPAISSCTCKDTFNRLCRDTGVESYRRISPLIEERSPEEAACCKCSSRYEPTRDVRRPEDTQHIQQGLGHTQDTRPDILNWERSETVGPRRTQEQAPTRKDKTTSFRTKKANGRIASAKISRRPETGAPNRPSTVKPQRPKTAGPSLGEKENANVCPCLKFVCKCGEMGCPCAQKSIKPRQHIPRLRERIPRSARSTHSNQESDFDPNFAATLKRPYPNSCERCFRYASPSRSPPNKPEQRYDPNFRRAHGMEEERERGGDIPSPAASPRQVRHRRRKPPTRIDKTRSQTDYVAPEKKRDRAHSQPPEKGRFQEGDKTKTNHMPSCLYSHGDQAEKRKSPPHEHGWRETKVSELAKNDNGRNQPQKYVLNERLFTEPVPSFETRPHKPAQVNGNCTCKDRQAREDEHEHRDQNKDAHLRSRCPHNSKGGGECNPMDYYVFYMSKNKERGDEDEVLIEELKKKNTSGKHRRKDIRNHDMREDQRQREQFRPESMAIRYQKGVGHRAKEFHDCRVSHF